MQAIHRGRVQRRKEPSAAPEAPEAAVAEAEKVTWLGEDEAAAKVQADHRGDVHIGDMYEWT